MIEYWNTSKYEFPNDKVKFILKCETNLFALVKRNTVAKSLDVN